MTVIVTEEMKNAGYAAIKKLAEIGGHSWALRFASHDDIYDSMEYIYKEMRKLEPAPKE